MTVPSILKRPYVWSLVLLIAADGLVLATAASSPRYGAALALLLFLPGWVWINTIFNQFLPLAERLMLGVGLSLSLTVFGAMLAVCLPAPISLSKLLIIANIITVAGLLAQWYQNRQHTSSPNLQSPISNLQSPKFAIIILALILLAAALRLPRLGYAEFHEDEAEALMLGVRLFQGEDYALFLHRKGPAQMLVPVSFWLLTDRITETLARFPFAMSSILSVVTLFFIGRRWFNWQAGLMAAALWATNGYAIAFGRMAQYQALIFFLGPLAIYCLYLAWQLGRMRFYFLGVILLATSLLAHFDALLLLPAAAYLTWLVLNRGEKSSPLPLCPPAPLLNSQLVTVILALALFVSLIAAFYIPFVLDPEFSHTATYLTETRVKPGLLYNNLDLLRRLDRDYSSHFFLPVAALGIFSFVVLQGRKVSGFPLAGTGRFQVSGFRFHVPHSTFHIPRPTSHATRTTHYVLRTTLFAIRNSQFALLLLSLTTFWLPSLWQFGPLNLAVLPWLLLGVATFWQANIPGRATLLMFGGGFIGYVFLVDDPRTHLYIMYPGAVLLAGTGLNYLRFWILDLRLFSKIPISNSQFAIRSFTSVMGMVWVALIVAYQAAIFLQTESTFSQLRAQWDNSPWEWIYDDVPTPREYFGYPKREGWKAIGVLRAQGHFSGDFRSVNEDFIIPIWYNYGRARSCYDTPAHFFVRTAELEVESVINDNYQLTGQVQREGVVRLQIYSAAKQASHPPETYRLQPLAAEFDALATPRQFAQQSEPSKMVDTQFGPTIRFVGFDLPTPTVAPGDTLYVNLYWLALDNPVQNYRAFVHLTDGATLWSQQDDTPACRLPTSIWRAGQHGVGQFRLPIPADIPPGRYPLIIGLYQADTLDRLKITGGAGKVGDDFLWLGDVEVVPPD